MSVMSTAPLDDFDDFEDFPVTTPEQDKKAAKKLERTTTQQAKSNLAAAQTAATQQAARLAQVVNLVIGGHSFESIGASIGASADEVEQMLARDAARYVRSQPALRTYVRNYISGKYNDLLEAVWDEATDKDHALKLENQDRALRILNNMAKLHGAEAPTQSEVKVDAAPETVEKMVALLAAQAGQGYDDSIFDTVPGEVVHESAVAARAELERSAEAVERDDEDDAPLSL